MIAIFGRVIDGVDVIGAGSKVAILMDVDGTVTGFDVDWPQYQDTGETEEAVDIQTVLARAEKLSIKEVAKRGKGAPETSRFECGLFDAGGRSRVRSPTLRFACSAHYSSASKDQQTEAQAVTDVIPGATRITAEPSWPEAMALCKGAPHCTGAGR